MMAGDADELFSLKAASLVMLLLSLTSLVLRFGLNRAFFNIEFEMFLVYVPTIVLLTAFSRNRAKEKL